MVRHAHPLPRARRALVAVAALATALATVTVADTRPSEAATVHVPVVFVHGYTEDSSMWDTMKASFKAAGYTDGELFAWNYDWAQSNAITADQLTGYVDSVLATTGRTQVDIVNHSMGGLVSRQYVQVDGGAPKVRNWVSLAGANNGTVVAATCSYLASCQEMIPGSPFIDNLNGLLPLPAGPKYRTYWSAVDGIIIPANSTVLPGATNVQVNPLINHLTIFRDPGVIASVRSVLMG
jgi:triacylglycerol lipase